MTVVPFAELADEIRAGERRLGRVRLVAIDGPGGAGKSVFAKRLGRALGGVPIVHTDDFASWDDSLAWWDRLESEVLSPLARGESVQFRAYDWTAHRLGEWRDVPLAPVILLEGVSSSRRAISERLTLAVWVETSRDERLTRGIARDGEGMRSMWDRWMLEEDHHYQADGARDRADVVVDGAPAVDHDPETSFVRLAGGRPRPTASPALSSGD